MSDEEDPKLAEDVLRKLSFFSKVLGEVDDWLDARPSSGPPRPACRAPAPHGSTRVTLENLELHLAREGR
ncbi:MAG: hypothetical protein HY721_26770 [Planctomycetes bacterium]|nr:hypothetical protein [Planctomycetota bacterium]